VAVFTLVACLLAEAVGFLVLFSGCAAYGLADFLFLIATVGLAAGGVASLILASRATPVAGRVIGIAALLFAGVSVPINVVLIGLSFFCALG
jgi:hypothetical protein